jgi:hypothetical protein
MLCPRLALRAWIRGDDPNLHGSVPHSARSSSTRVGVLGARYDGAIVLSCWSHKLKLRGGVLRYEDRLSRWEPNTPGKNLLIQHLTKARDEALPIRLVVATTDQPDVVDRGEPADKIKKTFHIKPEVEGRVVLFDGDNFRLEFRRQ